MRSFILVAFLTFLVCSLSGSKAVNIKDPEVSARVSCETTKGPLVIEIYREWAPAGADRFLELVRDGFYSDIALFRCVRDFLTQFGISDKPKYKHWHNKNIPDDPNLHIPIKKNMISYAGGGPNTRSTQLFIAFEDLAFLGKEPWETPFGAVVEGQQTLDSLYKDYGDIPPFGAGPDQQKLHNRGNSYIKTEFPNTDFILSCTEVMESVKRELTQDKSEGETEQEEGEAEAEGAEGAEERGVEEEGEEEEGEEETVEGEEEAEVGDGEETVEGEEEEADVEGEEEPEDGEEEEGEEGEEEEEEEPDEGLDGEEHGLLETLWSKPPLVMFVAGGVLVVLTGTYCFIRRQKEIVALGKSN